MQSDDYRALARSSSRDGFVATYGFYFLYSKGPLHPPSNPRRTQSLEQIDDDVEVTMVGDLPHERKAPTSRAPLVLAIRKVKDVFPNMITVGRTGNNDLVIKDISVSRFHAVFNVTGDTVTLSDAGSHNGTSIDGQPLAARGQAVGVEPGNKVRFGKVEFYMIDAATFWDRANR